MRSLAVAAILLSSSIAAAQAPGQTVARDPEEPARVSAAVELETVRVSYGNQVLLADAASLALILAGPLVTHDPQTSGMGLMGYALGAPIVHLAHGRGTAAVQSLGLRVGLPVAGMLAGYHLGPDDMTCLSSGTPAGGDHPDCGGGSLAGSIIGLLVGSVAAVAIDAKYLAHYEARRPTARWTANVQHARGGMTVGLSGAF